MLAHKPAIEMSKGEILTFVELDINLFAIVSTGWKTMSSAIPAEPIHCCQSYFQDSISVPYLSPAIWHSQTPS